MREKIVRVPELKTERSPEAEKAAPLNEKEGAFSGMAAPGQSESPTQFRTQPTEPLREIPNEKQETRQANLQESKCERMGAGKSLRKSRLKSKERKQKKDKEEIAWGQVQRTADCLEKRLSDSAERALCGSEARKAQTNSLFVAVGLLLVGFAAFYFAVGKKSRCLSKTQTHSANGWKGSGKARFSSLSVCGWCRSFSSLFPARRWKSRQDVSSEPGKDCSGVWWGALSGR